MAGMSSSAPVSSRRALEEFTDSLRFKYRGCAPDVDDPTRAAGDTSLSRNAWIVEDRDGVEPQREREAREAACIDVCFSCPVMVLCDRYANSVRPDGRLAEPRGIWGGRTARERQRLFDARPRPVVARVLPRPVPVEQVRTPQKLAVLLALAMSADPGAVADAAGLDVRTANWQRSRLTTQLGLCKGSATRMELLAVAVERGLLSADAVVADDGSVLAVPPYVAPAGVRPVQLPLWQAQPASAPLEAAA